MYVVVQFFRVVYTYYSRVSTYIVEALGVICTTLKVAHF